MENWCQGNIILSLVAGSPVGARFTLSASVPLYIGVTFVPIMAMICVQCLAKLFQTVSVVGISWLLGWGEIWRQSQLIESLYNSAFSASARLDPDNGCPLQYLLFPQRYC